MAAHLFSYIAMRHFGWWEMQYLKKIKKGEVTVKQVIL